MHSKACWSKTAAPPPPSATTTFLSSFAKQCVMCATTHPHAAKRPPCPPRLNVQRTTLLPLPTRLLAALPFPAVWTDDKLLGLAAALSIMMQSGEVRNAGALGCRAS